MSSSSSEETPTDWTEEEKEAIHSLLGNHLLPFYPGCNEIETWEDEYGYPVLSLYFPDVSYNAVSEYTSLLLKEGYEDVTSYVSGGVAPGEKVLLLEFLGGEIQAQLGLYDENENAITEGNGTFILDCYPDIPYSSFPEEEVSSFIESMGSTASLPVLEDAESYDFLSLGTSVWIQCFIETDPSSAYFNLLEKEGWIKDGDAYLSSDNKISCTGTYYASTSCFTIVLEGAA